jgi:hypothetical protein
MSCATIPDALRGLLATVAGHPGLPADRVDPQQYDVAVGYGWPYEYRDGSG